MRCPACLGPTHVLDSRPSGDSAVRRRRECLRCRHRFTTHERPPVEPPPLPPSQKVPA
jgi:transcriptional repressor NrdR